MTDDNAKSREEVNAYLARIRKTIADSESLVSQAQLRIAETDRMLEKQGLTREQVLQMHFSEAQFEMVNAELKRRGLDPLEKWNMNDHEMPEEDPSIMGGASDSDGAGMSDMELENRQRKFGMMMKPFQI